MCTHTEMYLHKLYHTEVPPPPQNSHSSVTSGINQIFYLG